MSQKKLLFLIKDYNFIYNLYYISKNNLNIADCLNYCVPLIFCKNNLTLNYYRSILKGINHQKLNLFFNFKHFRFVLFAGLGYKRKFYKTKRVLFSYIADRHWILYKFINYSTIIPAKWRSFLFIAKSKNAFNQDYNFFSSLRTPYVYKMKGFLDTRVKRRFIFIRRLKIKGIKTKLSKKQQML